VSIRLGRSHLGSPRARNPLICAVRSYEAEYVGSLWHFDAHHGSLKVLTPSGDWIQPVLFGAIHDRSRLLCHLQWYRCENVQNVAYGLLQALLRRGLPRAGFSDNGTAMCWLAAAPSGSQAAVRCRSRA
jgi:hypothetical protein